MAQPRFSLEQGRYVMSPNQMTYFADVRQPGDPFDPTADRDWETEANRRCCNSTI